jgi:hypothetical protein
VNQVNAEQIDGLIQDNHQIYFCELAKIVGISVDSIKTIFHDELSFSKASKHWIPKLLPNEQTKK